VKAIRAPVAPLLARLAPHPARAAEHAPALFAALDGWKHRVFQGEDVAKLLVGARRVQREEGSLGAAFARALREADAIFLGGGDQVHLVATIGGTPVGDAVYEAFCHGATVCGTSAGAAALTETTLAGGEIDIYGNEVEMYIGPGLGLLGCGALIDTHFAQRRRLHRLFVAIAGYPSLLGLGIDEDTALVVRGHSAEVRGKGGVTFVDGRTVSYDNASEITTGGQLTLSHLRVGLIGSGHRFDLERRELELLLDGSAQPVGAASELPQAKAMVGE
jgi:cyanophycinase